MNLQELKKWTNEHYQHILKKDLLNFIHEQETATEYNAKMLTISFRKEVEHLMQYLAENHHPHTTILITSTTAELVEGIVCHNTDKYIVD